MQFRTIIKILGQLVALFSITMVPPAVVSLIYKDGGGVPFVLAFIFSIIIGLIAYYPNRHENGDLKAREGFLIVVLFWLVLGHSHPCLLSFYKNLIYRLLMRCLKPFRV